MRVLIAVDLNDDDLSQAYGADVRTTDAVAGAGWDDLCASLDARMDEAGYFGRHNMPVRGRLLAAADFSGAEALPALLDAAEVGADGIAEDVAGHVQGSLVTFRQHLEAQTS